MASATATVRRRLTREARREQLLEVAEIAFAELGFQAASLEVIAARAGVTRPLFYAYFESKDELYVECLRRARAELEQAFIEAAMSSAEPIEQVRAAIAAYFRFVEERAHRWDVLFGGGGAVTGEVAERAVEMRFETVEKLAALGVAAAPDVPLTKAIAYAHAVSGAGEQLAKWWRRNPDVPLDDVVEMLLDVVWDGLRQLAPKAGR